MFKKAVLAVIILGVIVLAGLEIPAAAQHGGTPSVLSIRERAALVHRITAKRLDTLLPRMMRETGFDMWIISCNEDNLDPIFETMVPYENWNPITQILVLFDQGPEKGVERLNVSRTDTQGLFKNAWDAAAWDTKKGESQWEALGRIVRERDPKRIGLNEGEVQWAAGALTSVLKKRIVEAVGPKYAARLQSAEPLVTLWAETLLDEEVELMERAAALSRSIIADMFSSKVITVGQTTADDLRWYYWQRVADLGLKVSFSPFVSIRGPLPEGRREMGQGRQGHPARRPPPLRRRPQVHALEQRPPGDGLRPAPRRDGRAGDVQEAHGRGQPPPGRLLRGIQGRPDRQRDPRQHPQEGPRAGHPGPAGLLPLARLFPPRARAAHRPALGAGQQRRPRRRQARPDEHLHGRAERHRARPGMGRCDFRVPLEQDILFDGERHFFLAGRQTAFHLIK